ncbi:hypothetical protein AcW1_006637 [Taiwanofungus camphoratus]|nr:hypothetical protein AcW1_006637 [Antrodia cinnamomea]
MASSNSTITQEIVSILDQILPQDYVLVAVATMVFFEYIITVPQEVELVWRRKVSGSTIMFLLNRYIVVAFSILQICLVPSASTPKVCSSLSLLNRESHCYPF